jgi:dTDP-glucose 4,6-dehydratase
LKIVGRPDMPIVSDPERVRPELSEVYELVCDASKARERCGWASRVSLDEGLARTVDFIRENMALYRPGTYAR